jgi:phospholipid/cholesterol/gamma-HCH transport system substrate-binding protein
LALFMVASVVLTALSFTDSFNSSISVHLASDRAGLVMEPGSKVKLHGVPVGRVAAVDSVASGAQLTLDIDSDQIAYIPANVGAQIRAATAFGAKYVDLVYPQTPSANSIAAGAVLQSRNVSTEVNTVFENLVGLLNQIDPAKLNASLGTLAEGLRGRGRAMGQAITDTNDVLTALNPRMDTIAGDWRSLRGFSDAYGAAAQNILTILNAASTTSATIKSHASSLDALLLNVIGLSRSGIDLLAPNQNNLVRSVDLLQPTTDLLMKYNPEYGCVIQGAKWILDHEGDITAGGNGKSVILDLAFTWGDDPYKYPDNLPIVAAKGGPGGKPGCGSLPDASKDFPVRQLVANTGWGTGNDIRLHPGLGHPWYEDFFPVTRAVPQPPSVRGSRP